MRQKFAAEGTGHDWFHIERVWKLAQRIGAQEKAEAGVVSLGALLHDIADHKFHDHDLEAGPAAAAEWLRRLNTPVEIIERVTRIVREVSYKGAGVATPVSSIEAAVVQDADRLDAMGAVGIARAFAYGGSKNRLLYDPAIAPMLHDDFESYSRAEGTTINHFYEKLLLLKDRMNTAAGRRIAYERHQFMLDFLRRFRAEWEGRG